MPDDAATLPLGDLIVSLSRWRAEKEALLERGVRIGVVIAPDEDVLALADDLLEVWLVAIEFPAFNEGRGYSQSRLLRERLGFAGEIRAIGDVGRDRLGFMERSGFDSFELREGEDPESALAAFDEISVRYQPGAGDADIAARRRGWRMHRAA